MNEVASRHWLGDKTSSIKWVDLASLSLKWTFLSKNKIRGKCILGYEIINSSLITLNEWNSFPFYLSCQCCFTSLSKTLWSSIPLFSTDRVHDRSTNYNRCRLFNYQFSMRQWIPVSLLASDMAIFVSLTDINLLQIVYYGSNATLTPK